MTAPLQYGTPRDTDPTAVMGRRTLAWIADLLLYLAVAAAGFASMGEYVDVPPGVEDPCQVLQDQASARGETIGSCLDFRDMGIEEAESRVYLLNDDESGVQTVLSLGYLAFFVIVQGLAGGSPGKLLFGLRVVDQYGAKAGIGKSLARTLLWLVDAAPWIIPLVGPIAALTSDGHRRVGDLAAGTYVVSSSRVGQPVMTGSAPIPPGQQAWGAPPPTGPPTMPPGAVPGWSAPTLPGSDEPTGDWQPPATPAHDPTEVAPEATSAPFAAPGAEGPPVAASASTGEPAAAPRHELPPPQWDPARGTYLQWEPNRQAWLQWDATGQRWKPIDT